MFRSRNPHLAMSAVPITTSMLLFTTHARRTTNRAQLVNLSRRVLDPIPSPTCFARLAPNAPGSGIANYAWACPPYVCQ